MSMPDVNRVLVTPHNPSKMDPIFVIQQLQEHLVHVFLYNQLVMVGMTHWQLKKTLTNIIETVHDWLWHNQLVFRNWAYRSNRHRKDKKSCILKNTKLQRERHASDLDTVGDTLTQPPIWLQKQTKIFTYNWKKQCKCDSVYGLVNPIPVKKQYFVLTEEVQHASYR